MWVRSHVIADLVGWHRADYKDSVGGSSFRMGGWDRTLISTDGRVIAIWMTYKTTWTPGDWTPAETMPVEWFSADSYAEVKYAPDRRRTRFESADNWEFLGLGVAALSSKHVELSLPYWFFFVLTGPAAFHVTRTTLRRSRRVRHNKCIRCGYALVAECCPECGPCKAVQMPRASYATSP